MRFALFTGLLVGLALAGVAPAQTKPSSDQMNGWGADSAYNRLYNSSGEMTFSGVVTGIADSPPTSDMGPATTILVKEKNGGTATVDIGPKWFVDHQPTKIAVNDRVKVTGSKVLMNGRSFILARKVIKGNKALYVREVSGFPMWVATRGHIDVTGPSARRNQLDLGPNEASSATGPVYVAKQSPPDTTAQQPVPQTQTVQGQLQQMITIPDPKTGVPESFLVVNTPQGTVNVDLGPQWYIQQQSMNWTPGGNVVVNAMPPPVVPLNPGAGNPIYFANTLSYGNQYMVLRSGNITVWNPWSGY